MQSISEDEVKIQSKQVEGEVKSSTESVVEQNNEQQEDKNLVSSTVEDVDDMFAVKELWDEVKSSEEMGKRGEAFFLAQVLILCLIFFPPFEIQGLLAICSVLLVIAGLLSVWLAVFNLGRSISPFPIPRKNHHLVTNGIYGIVRHPMYAGVLLICSGVTLFTGGETRLLFTLLLAYLFNSKAAMEEKYMLERYPQEYKEYMNNSVLYRFLPLIF